ncbi:hypothetical protein K438DRAFT_2088039 [Mycena galopus ATCC 62051]|nr:hypothetical protein K438DRAFT_2088039 [Mycena galopus ATCC 62051]
MFDAAVDIPPGEIKAYRGFISTSFVCVSFSQEYFLSHFHQLLGIQLTIPFFLLKMQLTGPRLMVINSLEHDDVDLCLGSWDPDKATPTQLASKAEASAQRAPILFPSKPSGNQSHSGNRVALLSIRKCDSNAISATRRLPLPPILYILPSTMPPMGIPADIAAAIQDERFWEDLKALTDAGENVGDAIKQVAECAQGQRE